MHEMRCTSFYITTDVCVGLVLHVRYGWGRKDIVVEMGVE